MKAQHIQLSTKETLDKLEQFQLHHRSGEAIKVLDESIRSTTAQMLLKLEQEEQARLKAEHELLDLRRQQLEKEVLANSLIIDRKNDTKQIRDKIESGEADNIQKLIKEEILLQSDFEEIKMQVQESHPDFFNRLGKKAVQKLRALDLKYCTYLYLKMSTKQIAQALHVEPQSVRMFRYRLKQKFGLGKDNDLEDILGE